MNRWAAVLMGSLGVAIAALPSAYAQDQGGAGRGPQFLIAARQPSQPPVPVDAASVPVLRRRVSLDLENVTRADALDVLSRTAGLRLIYANGVNLREGRVRLKADAITVAAALTEVLLDAGVDVLLASSGNVVLVKRTAVRAAPTGAIAGRVTDTKTGGSIGGAEVFLSGTNWRATTDTGGRYRLDEVEAGSYTLTVRRFGYGKQSRPVTVAADRTDTVDVALEPVVTRLNEIVSTATGPRRRLDIANDVTTINADSVMQAAPIRNVTDLLEGRVPGLTVQHTSGAPGDPSRLRLRGAGSPLRNNDPVVFVDGIRVYAEQSAARSQNLANLGQSEPLSTGENTRIYATPSPLDYIDPNSIETIEVLKGPSAATLYGPDAANGVIVITTKKGKAGPTRWTASLNRGRTKTAGDYPALIFAWGHPVMGGAPQYCPLYLPADQVPCRFDSLSTFQVLNDPQLTILGPGYNTNLSLGASGGNAALTYSVTGSYQEDLGLLKLPTYEAERYQSVIGHAPPDWALRPQHLRGWGVTSGVTARLGSTADLTFHAGLSRTTQQRSSLENNLSDLMTSYYDPATGTYYHNGGEPYGGLANNPTGPLGSYYRRITAGATSVTNSAALNWHPRGWLTLTADAGLNIDQRADEMFVPYGSPRRAGVIGSGSGGDTTTVDTSSYLASGQGRSIVSTVNLRGNAQVPLGRGFQFHFAAGLNYNGTSIDDQSVQTENLAPGTSLLGSTVNSVYRSTVNDATFGWYLEPSVGNQKLNFTTGLRLDGGSSYGARGLPAFTFPPKFPKLGFSYLVSDEPWFPLKALVQSLRLRVAYGRAGRQPSPTERLRLYSAVQNVWEDGSLGPGVYLQDLGNADLRPERVTEWEGGFDTDLWDNRISVGLSAYHKTTDDAILQVPVPPSIYGDNVTISKNIGQIRNTGLELEVGASVVRSGSLTWQTTLQLSQNRNLVVRLGPGVQPFYAFGGTNSILSGTRVAAGYPLFGHWSLPVLGYADANGNGVLELSEIVVGDTAVYTGQSEPNYTASLASTVTLWHGAVTVNAGFLYTDGLAQDNGPWIGLSAYSRGRNDPTASLAEQALAAPLAVSSNALTDYYNIQTTSTFRFNSLSVRYMVPARVARWVRAQALSLAVQGSNLGLWTNYRGMDPGVNAFANGNSVADRGTLPQPRLWQVQVNAAY